MGTLHENLHAFLCMEMTGWAVLASLITMWGILCDNVIIPTAARRPAHAKVIDPR